MVRTPHRSALEACTLGFPTWAPRAAPGLTSRTDTAGSGNLEMLLPGSVRAVGLDMIARYFANPQAGSITLFGAGDRIVGRSEPKLVGMVPAFPGAEARRTSPA